MATANSQMQLTALDFDEIKGNLKTFLRSQDVLKDYNYEGSALAVLLDLLAYNTHYNAMYLNMAANEMFLDSSVKRNSVISHAKLLGYYPRSASAPTAIVNLQIEGLELSHIIIPKYTKFLSEDIDGSNYVFVTTTEYYEYANTAGSVTINDVVLKQGEPLTYRFTFNTPENPYAKFKIPHSHVDLESLEVVVQNSSIDGYTTIFNKPSDVLAIDGESLVYFIQETMDGYYEIYFGNGILGKNLIDGNIVIVTYLATNGDSGNGAKEFTLISNPIASYDSLTITTTSEASQGQEKETIESIKYTAPKAYSAQGRAITIEDYISLIQKNSGSFPIDSVNVWSGEENNPPVYGSIFVSLKPKGGYVITSNEKKRIAEEIIAPMSIMTVTPQIVDADYLYLKLAVEVLYDKRKTLLREEELKTRITQAIKEYSTSQLNTFNSTFVYGDLITAINDTDSSIITNDAKIYVEKKFFPTLSRPETYTIDFGFPIKKDIMRKSVQISPSVKVYDTRSNITMRPEVYIEESPSSDTYIESIKLINPGFNYDSEPTVTILGDGTGASAHAIVTNKRISSIVIDEPGINYTQAIIQISGGGGLMGSATPILSNRYGTLRSYYYFNGVKFILNPNVGIVDYTEGTVTLSSFLIHDVNNEMQLLSVIVLPDSTIIESKYNKILTLNTNDSAAISLNLKVK
jgi:hypothetical protein